MKMLVLKMMALLQLRSAAAVFRLGWCSARLASKRKQEWKCDAENSIRLNQSLSHWSVVCRSVNLCLCFSSSEENNKVSVRLYWALHTQTCTHTCTHRHARTYTHIHTRSGFCDPGQIKHWHVNLSDTQCSRCVCIGVCVYII